MMNDASISFAAPVSVLCRPKSASFPLYSVRKDRVDFLEKVRNFFSSVEDFKYRELEIEGPYGPEIVFAFNVMFAPKFESYNDGRFDDVLLDYDGWLSSYHVTPFPGDIPDEAKQDYLKLVEVRMSNFLEARKESGDTSISKVELQIFNPYTNEQQKVVYDLEKKDVIFEDLEALKKWPYTVTVGLNLI